MDRESDIAPILFLGAGFSNTFGIPTMEEMTRDLPRPAVGSPELQLLKSIGERLDSYEGYDIEAVLTVLELLSDPQKVQGLMFSICTKPL